MISLVAGTRPNFMKVAPIRRELLARGIPSRLIHTGQHFDASMSDVFFEDLRMAAPDVMLHVGGGTHAQQTAAVLVGVENELLVHRPHVLVVVGDVTSTLAAALAASKLGIKIAHVEAGLRSRDWTMPEEINRVLTDQLSDLLLVPSHDAPANLLREGVDKERIVFVGNVMIDSLYDARSRSNGILERFDVQTGAYALATLHRPANVDSPSAFEALIAGVQAVARVLPVLFPVHPRTMARAESFGLASRLRSISEVRLLDPLGYLDCVGLMSNAKFVATDSGGIQEETTALGVPCLTLREGTERPITVTEGTNTVVGLNPERIFAEATQIREGHAKRGRVPEGWDGKAAGRIVDALVRLMDGSPPAKLAEARA